MIELLALFDWLGIVVGIAIGGLINLTGVGGGVLIIPILTALFSVTPVMAVGTASVYATLTKLISSAYHARHGEVAWKTVGLLLASAIPTSLLTSSAVVALLHNPAYQQLIQTWVTYAVIAAMLLAVISMLKNTQTIRNERPVLIVIVGIAIGAIMALTGVGGGVLIIPALRLTTNHSMKTIVSCSIIIAFVLSMTAGIVYASDGQLDVPLVVSMTIGSIIGIYITKFIHAKITDKTLKYAVIALILLSALVMLLQQ